MSRVAILCHSTNPRGGVVHALELGAALRQFDHEAVVHAPDAGRGGFFRPKGCATVSVKATPLGPSSGTAALVETRVADYLDHFAAPATRRFDVFHAQDGISGNALATLKARGLIDGFARTVHHIDDFADPRVAALQERAIIAADAHFVVSRVWQDELAARYGIEATLVGNGVDRRRFSPEPHPGDAHLRQALGLMAGPVFLAIGGVEGRKNTVRILEAFVDVRRRLPGAQLVIAGGSSLLDHTAAQAQFSAVRARSGLPDRAVLRLGPIADIDMPGLYRLADALVFPSVREGFGLVVIEAMASGLPVITSRIPPFTGYLGDNDVLWCDPADTRSITEAMALSCAPPTRAALTARGFVVAARHGWDTVARAHLGRYAALGPPSMPEMRFHIRWPDGDEEACYSPSLVIKEFFVPGTAYLVDEFLARSRKALTIASDRVKAGYGFPCARALGQLQRIEAAARHKPAAADARVTILRFEE